MRIAGFSAGLKKAAKSVDLNGSTRRESVLVPSGKNSSRCPAASRASNSSCWAIASRGSRAMNTVPVARASQPIANQRATSALETK